MLSFLECICSMSVFLEDRPRSSINELCFRHTSGGSLKNYNCIFDINLLKPIYENRFDIAGKDGSVRKSTMAENGGVVVRNFWN